MPQTTPSFPPVKPAGWTEVQLKDVLSPISRYEAPMPGTRYRQLGVQLWGKGAYEREEIDGAGTRYLNFNRLREGDVVVNISRPVELRRSVAV